MSKKEKTWFNWHCDHCGHRHRVTFPWQIEMPNRYATVWDCEKCGNGNEIVFEFTVTGWLPKKKKIGIKKMEKKNDGTKKDRGYRNDRARQKTRI